jgi:zinc-binding in reverse transcriptase
MDMTTNIDSEGNLQWNLTSTYSFTVKSVYTLLNDLSIHIPTLHIIWKHKLPPRIKVFLWLTLLNKIHTADNLQRKGWSTISNCIMCVNHTGESIDHLLTTCTTTKHLIRDLFGSTTLTRCDK